MPWGGCFCGRHADHEWQRNRPARHLWRTCLFSGPSWARHVVPRFVILCCDKVSKNPCGSARKSPCALRQWKSWLRKRFLLLIKINKAYDPIKALHWRKYTSMQSAFTEPWCYNWSSNWHQIYLQRSQNNHPKTYRPWASRFSRQQRVYWKYGRLLHGCRD